MAPDPEISTSTRLFAVFGHPVAHSLSPAFQNAGLQAMGFPGVYLAFDVSPGNLASSLQTLQEWNAGGVNLTIPLKEEAFRLLDRLADSAAFAGSVNTVVFDGSDAPVGHSTDGAGLHAALQESFGHAFSGRRVLIFGCGGAGRAAALQAARESAAEVVVANRTRERAETVEQEIRSRLPGIAVRTCTHWPPSQEDLHAADLIIQSTSLGMKQGEALPLSPVDFREGQDFLDMIYTRPVTPMMEVASQAGVRVVNGIGMLLHQGVESLRLWTGQEPDIQAMRTALIQAVEKREALHGN